MTSLPLDSITVGARSRKDLGDIDALAASIANVGLLHPVVVDRLHILIAGRRRLEAVRSLGWDEVPVTVVEGLDDALKTLGAERDENTCRKDLVMTERLALSERIAELERPKAKERQKEHGGTAPGRNADTGGNLPQVSTKTRDKAAEPTGSSARTLDKVRKVRDLATDEAQPEPVREAAREALEEMDETGKVDGAYQKVAETQLAVGLDLDNDDEINRRKLRHNANKCLLRIRQGLLLLDPEFVAAAIEPNEWTRWEWEQRDINAWFERLWKTRKEQSGLRVVKGGAQ